jgi:hypothetical protein
LMWHLWGFSDARGYVQLHPFGVSAGHNGNLRSLKFLLAGTFL